MRTSLRPGGREPIQQAPPESRSFSIGVDLGGTNLRALALTQDGRQLASLRVLTPVEQGPLAVVEQVARMAAELIARFKDTHTFVGIGVGSPGPLELPSGILLQPPNLPGFHNFDLLGHLKRRMGVPVTVESDANAAAVAEWKTGAGRTTSTDSLCVITLGTGVGSGIIQNGRIWHGATGMSGEIGHSPIWPEGIVCDCGSRGCLERYASATAVRSAAARCGLDRKHGLLRNHPDASLSASSVAAMAHSGDADAIEIYRNVGRALGIGIAGLVNMLNLPLIVVGGGLSNAWDLICGEAFAAVREYSYVYRLSEPRDLAIFEPGKTNICRAQTGADAGLIGAALLPFLSAPQAATALQSISSPQVDSVADSPVNL